MTEKIIAALRVFMSEESGLDDIGFIEDNTDLIEAGVLDSLLMVMLVSYCEEEFNREIDLGDITDENFRSLNTIAEYVLENDKVG